VKEAKAAAEKSAQQSLGLEQVLQEIRDRLSAMEDFMKETTAITEESVAEEEDSETRRQLNDLMEKYATLKVRPGRSCLTRRPCLAESCVQNCKSN